DVGIESRIVVRSHRLPPYEGTLHAPFAQAACAFENQLLAKRNSPLWIPIDNASFSSNACHWRFPNRRELIGKQTPQRRSSGCFDQPLLNRVSKILAASGARSSTSKGDQIL